MAGLLAGKRLLITGVITKDSMAFHVAQRAQAEGAEIVLSSFGRVRRMTERAAQRLDTPVDVLELDVNKPEDLDALAAELKSRWGSVDGVLHAIAFAPEDALGGKFMTAPAESAAIAFQTSAFSLKALAAALAQLMPSGFEHRRPRLRRLSRLADLRLDGRRQGGAGVGLALPRTRPRGPGNPRQPRSAPARSAPSRRVASPASRSSPRSGSSRPRWAGTSRIRASSPARSASCSRISPAASPVRSSTSTAASTPSARRLSERTASICTEASHGRPGAH